VEGFWAVFFLLVVLKIPVFGALWLIWWASQEPRPETAADDSDEGFKRWGRWPVRPRGPHSGPYGGAMRRRGAPPAQRRPVFRPTPALRTAHSSSGGKPSKREGHPVSSPYTR